MAKVKLNLAGLNPQETVQLANTIKTSMTGNANFATPLPTLASITTLITTAQTSVNDWEAARDAAQMKTTERDNAITALRQGLTQLGGYVDAAAAGDEAKIQSAGMSVRASASAAGTPGQVLNLSLTAGDGEGQLDSQWDADRSARSFELQTSVDPFTSTSWVSQPSVTKSRTTINGLVSGNKVWLRVRGVGPGGIGPWSDPALKVVP